MISLTVKNINISGAKGITEIPPFTSYQEDLQKLKEQVKPFQKYSNIIILGHGGSRTSALAYYEALGKYKENAKNVLFLATNDLSYLSYLKKKYSQINTLIIAISKSGSTVSLLESLFYFKEYTILAITEKDSTLYQIAEKNKWHIILHPKIGGRFSAFTSCAYVPALLMGLNCEEIEQGKKEVYAWCDHAQSNPALHTATLLFDLEQKGYTEVFVPVYSKQLSALLPLLVQLMHESVCKSEKGQTFFGDEAPESQHHTNQRFFGGRKNCVGFFITRKMPGNDEKIVVPDDNQNISLGKDTLVMLQNGSYEDAFHAEFLGTWKDAESKGIPIINLEVDAINEKSLGELIAFFHLLAVYSSLLRKVNPYDQPQVESSKLISLAERKKH